MENISIIQRSQLEGVAQQSHTTRKKSKELLEEAKRKVEEMIENQ